MFIYTSISNKLRCAILYGQGLAMLQSHRNLHIDQKGPERFLEKIACMVCVWCVCAGVWMGVGVRVVCVFVWAFRDVMAPFNTTHSVSSSPKMDQLSI